MGEGITTTVTDAGGVVPGVNVSLNVADGVVSIVGVEFARFVSTNKMQVSTMHKHNIGASKPLQIATRNGKCRAFRVEGIGDATCGNGRTRDAPVLMGCGSACDMGMSVSSTEAFGGESK